MLTHARPSPAETPLPDDFICDPPVDSKRYTIDPSDSAFNIMTSQYQTKHSYVYRSSSCSTPLGVCRQASSPASFHDGNRNGEAVYYRLIQITHTITGKKPQSRYINILAVLAMSLSLYK